MSMVVNCIAYAGGRRIAEIDVDQIDETLAAHADAFVWLGLNEPDDRTLAHVRGEFGLHELAVEDAQRAHQRPKLEFHDDMLFLVLHTPQLWDGRLTPGETHLFAGPRGIISIRHGAGRPYGPVRARCEQTPELLAKGPAFVLYAIVDYIVDGYFPVVDALEDALASIEDTMFRAAGKRDVASRLYDLKRQLTLLRRAVMPLAGILETLMRQHERIPHDVLPYLRDVHDHVVRIDGTLDEIREMLTTALNVNLSLVTIGQNDIVKRLAGWGAILAIPTMVASFYGMNFEHMPELHWRFGYPAVLAVTGSACVLMYRRLRRAGWL